jgi:chemotaxis protein MotB
MARKAARQDHVNHERWLVSYADFITLLFAFFVVMFATSQTDKARAQQVSDSVNSAIEKGGVTAAVHEILGGTVDDRGKGNAQMRGAGGSETSQVERLVPAELIPSMKFLTKALEAEIKDGKVEIRLQPRGLVVSLRQAAFFPSGEDSIEPKSYASVEKIAETIRKLPNSVRLEGHTDSIPIHTARFRSNWELSAARGIAMLELLTTRFDVPRDHLAIAGYADTVPRDDNQSEEGRARNRRVDIVILNQLGVVAEPGSASASKQPEKAHAH